MSKVSYWDKLYIKLYVKFVRCVVRQLQERQIEMEMDLEPEERVPFVNFVDTIGRNHFDCLAEEMADDAVTLAEEITYGRG